MFPVYLWLATLALAIIQLKQSELFPSYYRCQGKTSDRCCIVKMAIHFPGAKWREGTVPAESFDVFPPKLSWHTRSKRLRNDLSVYFFCQEISDELTPPNSDRESVVIFIMLCDSYSVARILTKPLIRARVDRNGVHQTTTRKGFCELDEERILEASSRNTPAETARLLSIVQARKNMKTYVEADPSDSQTAAGFQGTQSQETLSVTKPPTAHLKRIREASLQRQLDREQGISSEGRGAVDLRTLFDPDVIRRVKSVRLEGTTRACVDLASTRSMGSRLGTSSNAGAKVNLNVPAESVASAIIGIDLEDSTAYDVDSGELEAVVALNQAAAEVRRGFQFPPLDSSFDLNELPK